MGRDSRIVFLSDAHLDGKDDRTLPDLMSFLRSLKGRASALYIGGDLFDFWIGDNHLCLVEYRSLLELLRELRDAGTEITYIEGNHDFYLGKFFTEVLGARVCPKDCGEIIGDRRVYLAHGDLADDDLGYRVFKLLIHNSLIKFLSYVLPPGFVWKTARLFSRRSRLNRNRSESAMARAFERFAEGKFREGYDAVILGHLHSPIIKEISRNGSSHLFVTLGDWMTRRTYLEYRNGTFTARTWRSPRRKKASSSPSRTSR